MTLPPGSGWVLSSAAAVLAAEAAVPVDPTGVAGYLAYGPLGLMVIGFLTGAIVPGKTAKRDADENDRLRKLQEEWLPILARNAEVTEKSTEVLERALLVIARMQVDAPPPRWRGTSGV